MKKLLERSFVMALVFVMLTCSINAEDTSRTLKMSDWARADVTRAATLGLVSEGLGMDYRKPVTRIQFADLVVRFVEDISGSHISVGNISFKDTEDIVTKKAAAAHIVKGTADGTIFSPNRLITREEIATMLYRAMQYVDQKSLKAASSVMLRKCRIGQPLLWEV